VVGASAEAGTAFAEIEGLAGAVDSNEREVIPGHGEQTEGGEQGPGILEADARYHGGSPGRREGDAEGSTTIIDEMSRLMDSTVSSRTT
jgi:hypothetical protein